MKLFSIYADSPQIREWGISATVLTLLTIPLVGLVRYRNALSTRACTINPSVDFHPKPAVLVNRNYINQ